MDSEMTKRLSQQQEKYEAKIIDLTNRLQNESKLLLPSSTSSSSATKRDYNNTSSSSVDNNNVSSSTTVISGVNNYHHSIEQNTIQYLKNIIEQYSVDELKVLLDTVHKLHHDHNNSTGSGGGGSSSSNSSDGGGSIRSSSSSNRDDSTISSSKRSNNNNKNEYENKQIVNTWINDLINLKKKTKSIDIHNIDSVKQHLSSSLSASALSSSSSSSLHHNQIQSSSIVITYCIDLIQFLSSQLYSILIKATIDRDQLYQVETKKIVENEINYENFRNYEKQCLFSNDPREMKYHSISVQKNKKNSTGNIVNNNNKIVNHDDHDDDDDGAADDNNDDGVKKDKKLLKIGSHLASFSKLDALRNINYYQHTNMLNLNFNAATISTSTTIATTTSITTSTTTTNATATMNSTVGLRNATIFGTIPTDKNHTNSMAIKSNDKDSDHINHLNHSHDHHHNDVDKDDNYIRSIGSRMDIVTKYNTVDELLSMLNKIKSHALCDIVTLHDYIERKDEALKR